METVRTAERLRVSESGFGPRCHRAVELNQPSDWSLSTVRESCALCDEPHNGAEEHPGQYNLEIVM
jgi:hypothetical protein